MIKLSFCFQQIPFLESSLFSVLITNVTSTNFWKERSCVSVFCTNHAKGRLQRPDTVNLVLIKKKTKKNCWIRIPGFHLSDKKCIYDRWTKGAGWGEACKTFLWQACACHFENLFDSIGTEELFTNVHEPIETMPYFFFYFIICQSEQFTMAIHLIFTHLIQMITAIHI